MSVVPGQSRDNPGASEGTLMDIGKWITGSFHVLLMKLEQKQSSAMPNVYFAVIT